MCILSLSSVSLAFGNLASATTGAVNFLPNKSYYPPNGFDTLNEEQLSLSTAQYITTRLASKYPNSYFSAYGATCTLNNYQTVTSYLTNNYDNVVFYSKGHRGMSGSHISLLDNVANGFYDHNIGSKTSYDKNRFTFIWHCQTAMYYNNNGAPNTDPIGAVGMPYAFTHNNYLQKWDTTGHQVYLGWVDRANYVLPNGTSMKVGSPQYEWKPNSSFTYSDVAKQFWNNMSQNLTTKDSLDTMSRTVYGNNTPFTSNNDLNQWLIVYGNWNLKLPA